MRIKPIVIIKTCVHRSYESLDSSQTQVGSVEVPYVKMVYVS